MGAKKYGLIALALLCVIAAGTGAVWWALWSVPDFYAEVEIPSQDLRREAAKEFVEQTLQLVDEIKHAPSWSEEFSQTQINSWLIEDLPRDYAQYVPRGVSEPRVQFVPDCLKVGFQFRSRQYDGVVSLRLRPFVPQPNRLAIEVQSVKAGLLPIPLDDVLASITRRFEKEGWQTEWIEVNGNETLVIELDRDDAELPVLETVDVVEGAIRISGSRLDEESSRFHGDTPRIADQSARN